jgi:sugar phosphate isomerase/epimerase
LAHEARHERVPPGEGTLDLAGFLAALPAAVPLAVEVQSDALATEHAPLDRAVLLRKAASAVVTGGS